MIFVDTGAWFAVMVRSDANNAAADAWFEKNTRDLITSDYVIAETLTLLRARGEARTALDLGELFFTTNMTFIVRVNAEDYCEAWRIFRDYSDKEWSFTDCTSKVLMQRLGIKTAFAFDHHFRQFGDIEVVP